jgi:hypothetical protein
VPIRNIGGDLFVPGWAHAIGYNKQTELRAAKRSVKARKAALATAALLQT